jgi:hypothetical protein
MKWMTSMLADGVNGSVSSKRTVTLLAFLLCAAGFLGDLIWNLQVRQFVYEGMMYIAIAGLGFTASEKFSKGSKDDTQ